MEEAQNKQQDVFRLKCFAGALLGAVALRNFFAINTSLYAYSNSVLSIFACVALYYLYKKAFAVHDRRATVLSVILGIMYAVMLYAGNNLLQYDTIGLANWKAWIWIFFELPLFVAIVKLLLTKVDTITKSDSNSRKKGKIGFFIIWGIVFLSWVPCLLSLYPGIFANDSLYQISYYQNHWINLHHPLIHTYLMGIFIETLGWGVFHSRELGMLLYSLFQMTIMSAFFASIYSFLKNRAVHKYICWGFLLLFMLLPTNALSSISSTKDMLYSVLFASMVLFLFFIAEKPERLDSVKFSIAFILICFGQMIFRSQGKYVFLLAAICAVFFLEKYWKKFLCLTAIILALFSVYSGPITKALHGVPMDSKREYMSVPVMQFGRVMLKHADDLTEEERDRIKCYVPDYENYSSYPAISDSLKRTFNDEAFNENPKDFLSLWIEIGKKHPMTYIDAWARLSIGLWYPDMNYRDPQAYHTYWQCDCSELYGDYKTTIKQSTPKQLEWLANFYRDLTYNNTYQEIPVLSVLFSSGILFWLLLFYIGFCIYRKKYRLLCPAFALFWLWVSMMFGPVVLYRYMYPMVLCVPVLIGIMTGKTEYVSLKKKKETEVN